MASTAQLLSVRTKEDELYHLLVIRISNPTQGKRCLLSWLDKDRKSTSTPKLELFSEPTQSHILSLLQGLTDAGNSVSQLPAQSAKQPLKKPE